MDLGSAELKYISLEGPELNWTGVDGIERDTPEWTGPH